MPITLPAIKKKQYQSTTSRFPKTVLTPSLNYREEQWLHYVQEEVKINDELCTIWTQRPRGPLRRFILRESFIQQNSRGLGVFFSPTDAATAIYPQSLAGERLHLYFTGATHQSQGVSGFFFFSLPQASFAPLPPSKVIVLPGFLVVVLFIRVMLPHWVTNMLPILTPRQKEKLSKKSTVPVIHASHNLKNPFSP